MHNPRVDIAYNALVPRMGTQAGAGARTLELSIMETRTTNLLDTVKRGCATDALLQELEAETQRKKALVCSY